MTGAISAQSTARPRTAFGAEAVSAAGRAIQGNVRALMREYGISARLTFSNSLLRTEHLRMQRCNALCALFSSDGQTRNGVIVHSDVLLDYLQKTYPKLYFVSSTTKVLTEFGRPQARIARDAFCMLCRIFGSIRRLTG